jgi:thiamine-monophosphate kinase
MNEISFIDYLKKKVPTAKHVLAGIGDDAAVLQTRHGDKLLLTTDMLIEDQHFKCSKATGFEIGWKAMAVNISDIAAMGGLPTHAVVSVGLPKTLSVDFVKEIYKGLQAVSKRFHVSLVGGDTNASKKIVISVALLGRVGKKQLVKRAGARIGDVIFVTGFLGGSYNSKKHLNFTPRIAESQYLVNHFKIHAMMDISDGLASDIFRLAQASGVGAILSKEAIPVSESARDADQALTEGEDFELLFTLSPKEAARLTLSEPSKKMAPFHPIGKIISRKQGVRLARANQESCILQEKGYDHFRE